MGEVGPDHREELAKTTLGGNQDSTDKVVGANQVSRDKVVGANQASTDKVVVANHDRLAIITSLLPGIIRIFRE